jgi:hypothetical protein
LYVASTELAAIGNSIGLRLNEKINYIEINLSCNFSISNKVDSGGLKPKELGNQKVDDFVYLELLLLGSRGLRVTLRLGWYGHGDWELAISS